MALAQIPRDVWTGLANALVIFRAWNEEHEDRGVRADSTDAEILAHTKPLRERSNERPPDAASTANLTIDHAEQLSGTHA